MSMENVCIRIIYAFLFWWKLAEPTELESATSCLTGKRSNQLSYGSIKVAHTTGTDPASAWLTIKPSTIESTCAYWNWSGWKDSNLHILSPKLSASQSSHILLWNWLRRWDSNPRARLMRPLSNRYSTPRLKMVRMEDIETPAFSV